MAGAAPVGGRMEPAPVRKVTNPGDRWRLVVLLLAAAGVHALVVSRTVMTARDGIGFARTALQLVEPAVTATPERPHPTVFDVVRTTQHPPGYPVALLATSTVTPGLTVQDRMLFAGQLVSAVAGTLLVVPLYWLGRTLFGQAEGFAGALLFTCLPVAARYTSDAVTEGLYLLCLCTAILLGTRAVRKPTIGGFLLCGMACGVAYLVRPEGALAAAAVGLVVMLLAIVRREPVSASAGRLVALTVGFLIALPYMLIIGGVSNKPTPNKLFEMLNLRQAVQTGVAVRTGPPLFAAAGVDKPVTMLAELTKEGTKAFHYVPPVFALVGLTLAARRLRADPWLLVPLTFAGLMLPVLVALGLKEGYVSERHTLSVVMMLCPFAAAGFGWLGERLGKPWLGWLLFAVVLLSTGPGLAKSLHKDRLAHKQIGEYLREHAAQHDIILDPYDWAVFYSGRTLKSIPEDPPAVPNMYRWAIVEPDEKNPSKLPRLQDAWNVVNDTKDRAVEIQFGDSGAGKVKLYKQKIPATP